MNEPRSAGNNVNENANAVVNNAQEEGRDHRGGIGYAHVGYPGGRLDWQDQQRGEREEVNQELVENDNADGNGYQEREEDEEAGLGNDPDANQEQPGGVENEHGEDDVPDPWEQPPNPPPPIVAESLPSIMGQNDTLRMKLLRGEWELAWDIKGMNATDPELDLISDFCLAQIALISQDATVPAEDALRRLVGLQTFRQEYEIKDTEEEGCRAVADLVKLMPGLIIHFGFQPDTGTYMIVEDLAKFDTSNMKHGRNFKKLMVGCYYLQHALTCDLESIRKGVFGLIDCLNIGWTMKGDFKILKEFFFQLEVVYPFQVFKTCHYNCGVIFNLLHSMAKKALPKEMADQLEFGHVSEEPLSNIFLVPTAEAGTKRVILQLQAALKRRYEHEKTFSLH